jgi:hypothetical protein
MPSKEVYRLRFGKNFMEEHVPFVVVENVFPYFF